MAAAIYNKDERLTLRISKKDKFALELLALKNKSSLSAAVMESLEPTLRADLTIPNPSGKQGETVYIPDEAYDLLVPDRLVKLAMIQRKLLSEQEQIIWKAIKEKPELWIHQEPNFKLIRNRWKEIQKIADGLVENYSS